MTFPAPTAPGPPSPSPVPAEAILNAAEELFARRGFAATTIKAIGSAAGVNPALLYYYFHNKEGLYHAVLDRVVGGLARGGMTELHDVSPVEGIRRFTQFQARYFRDHPHLPALMMREILDHEAAHAHVVVGAALQALFGRLQQLVIAGQQTGTFRSDLTPSFAAISTIAQLVYFTIARPALAHVLRDEGGEGGAPSDVARRFAEHAGTFALAALQSGIPVEERP